MFVFCALGAQNHTLSSTNTPPRIAEVFSEKLVKSYLDSLDLPHKDVVFAQIVLETGNFTSTIFKENNNLCGMRYVDTVKQKQLRAAYRRTIAVGERYGHAVYANWRHSITDYMYWQQMFKKNPVSEMSESQYLAMLGKVYATDNRYVNSLKYLMNKDATDNINTKRADRGVKKSRKNVQRNSSNTRMSKVYYLVSFEPRYTIEGIKE